MWFKKKFCFIIFLLISLLLLQSVSFANSMAGSFALGLERDIGLCNYPSVIEGKTVVQLPQAEEQNLHSLFQRLVRSCHRSKELKFTITVVQDDSVNAFALPAGYVFVNTGLLSSVKNDGELAGILAHEIAHIERRHSMKAIYRAVGFSVVLSLLLNNGDNVKRMQEMGQIAGISMRLAQLGYSREAELEADRYGVEIMEKAGYNKQDILNFWQRFRWRNGDSSRLMNVFSTHPSIGARIEQIKKLP
jgi:beta-barrel assembly-enhancing protease